MCDADTTVAVNLMTESTPLAPRLQKACSVLMAAGAVLFIVGLALGFIEHANSVLLFFPLGTTTLGEVLPAVIRSDRGAPDA